MTVSALVAPQVENSIVVVDVAVQRNHTSWWIGPQLGCWAPSVEPTVLTAIVPVVASVVADAQSSAPCAEAFSARVIAHTEGSRIR